MVRADDRKVLCAGQETALVAVAERLRQEGAFEAAGPARYHGHEAKLFVAEAEVVLHRPGIGRRVWRVVRRLRRGYSVQ